MKNKDIKKVLIIGSGPIIIGQAAEFDYAGVQACIELKKNGIKTVVINSNPATIMTDKEVANYIYIEELNIENIEKIIKKEKPDSILPNMGGQTGLNLTIELYEKKILQKYNIKLLGTSIESIKKAEDRMLFKKAMEKINQPCIPSEIVTTLKQAQLFVKNNGYPVIIRPAYTMGGLGGGIAHNDSKLEEIVLSGLRYSRINQILIEKDVTGWKEIEFEVLRDRKDNTIAVCNLENFDPVGIHTGDSIVIAPCQTLTDVESQMLRTAAINIIKELKIEGGCNVQFALDPFSLKYGVIEVNPRVSRSSALASKATGYPIARISTLLSIGYTLDEIKNPINNNVYALYEPTLDYIAVKIAKFPFDKFPTSPNVLTTQMQATGEVLGLGACFEEALLKAYDSLGNKEELFNFGKETKLDYTTPSSYRLNNIFKALGSGISVDKIYKATKIDKFYLNKIKDIIDIAKSLKPLNKDNLSLAKKYGMTDKSIGYVINKTPAYVKSIRTKYGITPHFKKIDACGAEFASDSNYFYSSYSGFDENKDKNKQKKVLIIGSGPIKIGQGIEFDYCCVHAIWKMQKMGYTSLMINSNPETFSTDFDLADKLFFEPITHEYLDNILEKEKPYGVFIQFGGGTAINLAQYFKDKKIKVLGTDFFGIEASEDRKIFNKILADNNIPQAPGSGVLTLSDAIKTANKIGYPVLIRPSFVLGGQGMGIVHNDKDLTHYFNVIKTFDKKNSILIDKYLLGMEYEIDAISDGKNILIPAIMEQIEWAGVHSGDSMCVFPTTKLSDKNKKQIIAYAKILAKSLKIMGVFNIQYVVYDDELYIIEVNPRASRTIPYVSKITNIPIIDLSIDCIFGKKLENMNYGLDLYKNKNSVYAVKAPIFSFNKIKNADISLSPMMKSTGEILATDKDYYKALAKAFSSSGVKIKNKNVLIITEKRDLNKQNELIQAFKNKGFNVYLDSKDNIELVKTKIGLLIETKDNNINAKLRTTAINYRIPIFTSLYTALAFVESYNN